MDVDSRKKYREYGNIYSPYPFTIEYSIQKIWKHDAVGCDPSTYVYFKQSYPKTMGVNTKSWSNDSDDMGYPYVGYLHIDTHIITQI